MTEDATAPRRPSSSMAVRLRQTEELLRERLTPILTEYDLALDHWRIIAVVGDHPGIGMTTVASSAVVTAASLTRHMDKLVERGIVVRHIDPADRRRCVVALSPLGGQLADRLHRVERDLAVQAPEVVGSTVLA